MYLDILDTTLHSFWLTYHSISTPLLRKSLEREGYMMEQELLNLVSARRGHFRLESGHHGDLWLDLDRLFVQPAILSPFTTELGRRLAAHQIDAVCGPLTGGAFVAQMIAAGLGVEFYYAERLPHPEPNALYAVEYRIPGLLRSSLDDKRIAIVDDAVNAASAVRATLADLEDCGAQSVAMGALLLLGSHGLALAASLNIPLVMLAQLPSQTWEPAACPLCVAGVPLEDLT
ncbi:MAG TPA: phosphoribosyltransferase family protein [Ktedonobacterales bacterium]|nr:phosphoribosyltransferase family protein [Ktedonobacterales bacterium]